MLRSEHLDSLATEIEPGAGKRRQAADMIVHRPRRLAVAHAQTVGQLASKGVLRAVNTAATCVAGVTAYEAPSHMRGVLASGMPLTDGGPGAARQLSHPIARNADRL